MSNAFAAGYQGYNALDTTGATNPYGQTAQYSSIADQLPTQFVQTLSNYVTDQVVSPAVDSGFDYFQKVYQNYLKSRSSYVQTTGAPSPPQMPMSAPNVQNSYMP